MATADTVGLAVPAVAVGVEAEPVLLGYLPACHTVGKHLHSLVVDYHIVNKIVPYLLLLDVFSAYKDNKNNKPNKRNIVFLKILTIVTIVSIVSIVPIVFIVLWLPAKSKRLHHQ